MSEEKNGDYEVNVALNEAIHMIAGKYTKAEDCFSCDVRMTTEEIIIEICKNNLLNPSDINPQEVIKLLKRNGFNNMLIPGKIEWTWPFNLRR